LSPPLRDDTKPRASFLIAAIAINLFLGVLYGWSLFLAPLEELLQMSRAGLSLVPALGLLCFTVGVLAHDAVIRRIRLAVLASGVAAATGLGHLTFWLFPSYLALLSGYGVLFGSAAGIGYGLALALARTAFAPIRGWAVGLTVAAFAAGGMAVSAMGAAFGPPHDIANLFGVFGGAFLLGAVALGLLLQGSELTFADKPHSGSSAVAVQRLAFLRLAFGYFVLCYLGLLVVSHGVAILAASGARALLAPFVLNAGYIAGAFLGGVVAARNPGRAVPLAFLFASTASALTLSMPLPPAAAAVAVFVIGSGFGSTVSVFVMMLTRSYGTDRVGALFGRLNISYGLAGFLAPSITGWMYELSGDYTTSLWFGGFLGVLGLLAMAGNTDLSTQTSK
jgi:hypothetical protein